MAFTTIAELGDAAPQWLRDADTADALVEVIGGDVVWRGGATTCPGGQD